MFTSFTDKSDYLENIRQTLETYSPVLRGRSTNSLSRDHKYALACILNSTGLWSGHWARYLWRSLCRILSLSMLYQHHHQLQSATCKLSITLLLFNCIFLFFSILETIEKSIYVRAPPSLVPGQIFATQKRNGTKRPYVKYVESSGNLPKFTGTFLTPEARGVPSWWCLGHFSSCSVLRIVPLCRHR